MLKDKLKPYYKRLFHSMVLTFLIPALISVLIAVFMSAEISSSRLAALYTENLLRIASSINNQLESSVKLAVSLANDYEFASLAQHEYNVMDIRSIQTRLINYTTIDNSVSDIMVFINGFPSVCAASGIYPNGNLIIGCRINGLFINEYVTNRENCFKLHLADIETSYSKRKALIYAAFSATNPDINVITTINTEVLNRNFSGSMFLQGKDNYIGIMFDERRRVVFSSETSNSRLVEEISSNLDYYKNNSVIKVNKKNYLFSRASFPESSFMYVTAVPYNGIFSFINSTVILILVLFMLIVIASYFAIRYITDRNYSPVRVLFSTVNDDSNTQTDVEENELVAINKEFIKLKDRMSTLDTQLSKNIYGVRLGLMNDLINGKYESIESFNTNASFVGVRFIMFNFWMILLVTPPNTNPKKEPVSVVESKLPYGMEAFGVNTMNFGEYLFIIAANNEEYGHDMLYELHREVGKALECEVCMVVSNCYTDIGRIGKAYIETKMISGEHFWGNKLIFFSEQMKLSKSLKLITGVNRYCHVLQRAIYEGDLDLVSDTLGKVLNYIEARRLSVFATRCICYELISTVIHVINDLVKPSASNEYEFPQVTMLTEFSTLMELTDLIYSLSRSITEMLGDAHVKNVDIDFDCVIGYIEENCTNPNMSVQHIAEEFSTSLSVLSQLFKSKMGKTTVDYIFDCRMKKAKEFLKDTDMPISEVVRLTGYLSVPTFVNKFKRVTGVTPGEYRSQYTIIDL